MNISPLSRLFLSFFLLLLLGLAVTVVETLRYEPYAALKHASRITTLPGIALSVPYYETRFRDYRDASGHCFPGIAPIESMDFIYAK